MRSLSRVGVAGAFIAACVVLTGFAAYGDSGCVKADLIGVFVQPFPGGTAEGDAEMMIDGVAHTAHVSIDIIRAKATEDGTQETDWAVASDLGGGNTFGGIFHGVLSQTDSPYVFRVNAQGKITEGTGAYEDSYGKFVFHGDFVVTLDPFAEARMEASGRLCNP